MPCRDVNVALVARLNNITFACEEPVRLAEFWREALGYEHIEVLQEVDEAAAAAIERGELDADGWAMLVNRTAPAHGFSSSGGRRPRRRTSRSISTSTRRNARPRSSG
jgi:hypothetical protein